MTRVPERVLNLWVKTIRTVTISNPHFIPSHFPPSMENKTGVRHDPDDARRCFQKVRVLELPPKKPTRGQRELQEHICHQSSRNCPPPSVFRNSGVQIWPLPRPVGRWIRRSLPVPTGCSDDNLNPQTSVPSGSMAFAEQQSDSWTKMSPMLGLPTNSCLYAT